MMNQAKDGIMNKKCETKKKRRNSNGERERVMTETSNRGIRRTKKQLN